MAEQAFRSPGFFDTEIDQSITQPVGPTGTPAGIISTSDKGPAFVPVTVSSFADFRQIFGDLNIKKFGPYAAAQFLAQRNSLTFLRVLGVGTAATTADITNANLTGQFKNAGFVVTGSAATGDGIGRHMGAVQFIAAQHTLQANEAFGIPMFTENDSFGGSTVNVVRGMLMCTSGTRIMLLDRNASAVGAFGTGKPFDNAVVSSDEFKLVISSTLGTSYGTTDGNPGVRIYTASLNPTSNNYYAKLLNQDPERFGDQLHLLYADFPVDDEVATPTTVAVLSGSSNTSTTSGNTTMPFRDAFGHFDTMFKTPRTPNFISQPFGAIEYDLFRVESLDDGAFANARYKISISNLQRSTDQRNPYGTFTLLVRDWSDDDVNARVLEQFPQCSLDPASDRYIAKIVGDRKVSFDNTSENSSEHRLVSSGKYPNQSKLIRVVMTDAVERQLVPPSALPFGFRGPSLLKTNDTLTNGFTSGPRLTSTGSVQLSGSILPPVPYRFKITRGAVATSGFVGNPGSTTLTNLSYYWGAKFERNTTPLDANIATSRNLLLDNYTKFLGIEKLDVLVTGSGVDTFNNNKFTLARVAFSNTAVADLTGTVEAHMREAAYVRNGRPDSTTYTVNDGTITKRITFATLAAQTGSTDFNRFTPAMKFTTFMYGGFDGLNILDKQAARMTDKSVSLDIGGGGSTAFTSPGLAQNQQGAGLNNSILAAYQTAAGIMTNPLYVNLNILAVPGIREPLVTDYVARTVRDYGQAIYLMDIPTYDDSGNRLYGDTTVHPDVTNTAKNFDGRSIDNSYVATYFPDVLVDDPANNRRVKLPASIAALAALALNDRVAYPWYAPAGFNRASLDFVKNVDVRLNGADRDALSDVRINPIAPFPPKQFVIFAQKTLQQANTALNRVNVRRLVLEVKRQVVQLARGIVWEQNVPEVRTKFVGAASLRLGLIQTQFGIESYDVVMDARNNTTEDEDNNRLNGRVVIVPTRAIEEIAVDFIITQSGVTFAQ